MRTLIFAFVLVLTDKIYGDECSAVEYGPQQELNFNPGNWVNVFVEREFTCEMMVDTLDFYAVRPGEFFVSFWRKVSSTPHSYQMVRKVRVSVDKPGKDTMRLNEEARMMVRDGYVLGIHYPENSYQGVVSYEDSRNQPTEGVPRSMLQNFINADILDGKLKENQLLSDTYYTTIKRAVALSVSGQPIQILGGDTQPRKEVDQASGHSYIPNFKQAVQKDGFLTRFEFLAEAGRDTKVQLSVWRGHDGPTFELYKQYVVSWSRGATRIIRFTPEKALEVKQGDRIGLGFYQKSPLHFDKVKDTCEDGPTYYMSATPVDSLKEGSTYFFRQMPSWWGSCRQYSLQAAIVDQVAADYQENNADLDCSNGQLNSDLTNQKRSLSLTGNSTSPVRRHFSESHHKNGQNEKSKSSNNHVTNDNAHSHGDHVNRDLMRRIYTYVLRNNNNVNHQSDQQVDHGKSNNTTGNTDSEKSNKTQQHQPINSTKDHQKHQAIRSRRYFRHFY